MDAREAARRWVDAWDRGWRATDPETIAAVYADDCVFRSHPFREPSNAREYARQAFAEESLVDGPRWAEPVVDGDRAAVEYWATLRGDEEATLAGVTLLRFRDDGLVVEHRDYWATAAGRRGPNF